jgi:hypothetical protein
VQTAGASSWDLAWIGYEFVLRPIVSSPPWAREVSKPCELLSLNRKTEFQGGEPGMLSFKKRTRALTTGRFIFMRGTRSFSQ